MSTEQNTRREMVFCHQCEEEWWRDEHGLVCPQCSSEFTEVIEQNDDPRDAPHPMDLIQQLGGLQSILNTGGGGAGAANGGGHNDGEDRDFERALARELGRDDNQEADSEMERDSEGLHWSSTGPNSYSVRGTVPLGGSSGVVTDEDGGRRPQEAPTRTTGGSAIGGIFGSLLNAIGGSGSQQTLNTENGGTTTRNWSSSNGGLRFSMSTTTTIGGGGSSTGFQTRSSNTGQPLIGLNDILGTFGGTNPQGGPHGDGSPNDQLAILEMFLNHARFGAPPGYANGPEDFDRIISDLMDRTAGNNGTPGAAETEIEALPTKEVDKGMLGDSGKAECTICMSEVELGETVTELYCHHWFHTDCIRPWLEQHDTCPHCRMSIEAAKEAAERKTNPAGSSQSTEGNNRKRSDSSSLGADRSRQYQPTPEASSSRSSSHRLNRSNSEYSRSEGSREVSSRIAPTFLFGTPYRGDSTSTQRGQTVHHHIPRNTSRLRSIRHADDIPEERPLRGHERPAPPIPPFSPVTSNSNRHSLSDMFFSASTLSSSDPDSSGSSALRSSRPSRSSSQREPPRVPFESRPSNGSYLFHAVRPGRLIHHADDMHTGGPRSSRPPHTSSLSDGAYRRTSSYDISSSSVGDESNASSHSRTTGSARYSSDNEGGVLSRVRNWLTGSRS